MARGIDLMEQNKITSQYTPARLSESRELRAVNF